MKNQLNTALRWSVFGANQNKIKALIGGFPTSNVADMNPIGPLRKSAPRKVNEVWNDIQPVGFDVQVPVGAPALRALHQNSTCTADIKKCAASMKGFGDKST